MIIVNFSLLKLSKSLIRIAVFETRREKNYNTQFSIGNLREEVGDRRLCSKVLSRICALAVTVGKLRDFQLSFAFTEDTQTEFTVLHVFNCFQTFFNVK